MLDCTKCKKPHDGIYGDHCYECKKERDKIQAILDKYTQKDEGNA